MGNIVPGGDWWVTMTGSANPISAICPDSKSIATRIGWAIGIMAIGNACLGSLCPGSRVAAIGCKTGEAYISISTAEMICAIVTGGTGVAFCDVMNIMVICGWHT